MAKSSQASKAPRMIERPREWLRLGVGAIGAAKVRLERFNPPHWSAWKARVVRATRAGSAGVAPIDWMTGAFAVANLAYLFAFRGRIADAASLFIGYAACLAATIAIVVLGPPDRYAPPRSRLGRAARWLHGVVRDAYPFAMLVYFFVAVTRFDTALLGADLDPLIASFDARLFGVVPATVLMGRFDSPFASEVLHAAYVLYYATIPGLAFYLYAKDKAALREYVFVSMFIFYAACLTYAVLPVVGARYDEATRVLTETYRHGPFTRIMAFIYKSSGHEGAAFPSTHAIQSAVIAITAYRRAKPIAAPLAINAALVWIATIYCGYHYVADLIAAAVYLAALMPLAIRLCRRFQETRRA